MRIVINAIGIGRPQPVTREIVGVVKQVKQRPGDLEDGTIVYVPRSQNTWNSAVLVVTPAGGAVADLAPAVRAAIARVNRSVPVGEFQTLEQVTRGVIERPRFRTVMVMTFAALALILAMVGVFGCSPTPSSSGDGNSVSAWRSGRPRPTCSGWCSPGLAA